MTHPSILLLRWYLLLVNIYPSSPRELWALVMAFGFVQKRGFFPIFFLIFVRPAPELLSRSLKALSISPCSHDQGVLKNTQLGGQEGVALFFIRLLGREGNLVLQSCHLAPNSPLLSPGRMMLRLGSNRMGWR